jgi:cell division septal protein FtsQ
MATQTRKRVVKPKTNAVPKRRRVTRATTNARRSVKGNGSFANFFVPLFFILCILFCLGFLGVMGYRTVTASEFFEVKKIDVRGVSRASRNDIEKIVEAQSVRSGVWNTNLSEIKEKVERLAYVKSAAVSRVLPDGVRVNVIERMPKAIVRIEGGDFWADEEGAILGLVSEKEERLPFVLKGWNTAKTDEAVKENQQRVKMFQKMLEDWREFDLSKRVETVDLSDLRTPQAFVQDSGESVLVILAKDNFGKKLQTGLEKVAGKGQEIASIDVSGIQPVLGFRKKNEN